MGVAGMLSDVAPVTPPDCVAQATESSGDQTAVPISNDIVWATRIMAVA